MSPRRYYRPGDTLRPAPSPFVRHGYEHTLGRPFYVEKVNGHWQVSSRVEGPMTYGGLLVTKALFPEDAKGRTLHFATRRDAHLAMVAHEAGAA